MIKISQISIIKKKVRGLDNVRHVGGVQLMSIHVPVMIILDDPQDRKSVV